MTEQIINNKPGTALNTLGRVESIDLLRGFVMIIMALDHTRDFFTAALFNPLDLVNGNAYYFITRWITHFCAPVFVFFAGTSAFLYGMKCGSKKELSKYLLMRGALLVILELTLVRLGWQFNVNYSYAWVQVIWVLGIAMIILSGLIYLPLKLTTGFGIIMILFHNLLDGIEAGESGIFRTIWIFLHEGGEIRFGNDGLFWVVYPLIPWIGVMAAGYGFGKIFLMPAQERNRILIKLGLIITTAFIVLRALNFYGDPHPWIYRDNWFYTFLEFLNTEKYPPSLLFLMMTLGPSFITLVLFEKLIGLPKNILLIFGRVPLFFYLLHVPVIHLLAVILALLQGLNPTFLFDNSDPSVWPLDFGYGLFGVYVAWLIVIVIMYPLSDWFCKLKRKRKYKWLSYL